MKKIFGLILVAMLITSTAVFAAGQQGGYQTGQNNDTGRGEQVQEQTMARNYGELQEMVQERKMEMEQETEQLGRVQQKVYQNQNMVRLAVHAMLAMENLTGKIGPNVSAIAREFNNSVQATIRAEERIENRNALVRFFVGGDETAAAEIEAETVQNRARIQKLNQLMNQCECDEQTRAMLQEQIQNIEQEQTRLQKLAQKEKQDKGIFGWLWK